MKRRYPVIITTRSTEDSAQDMRRQIARRNPQWRTSQTIYQDIADLPTTWPPCVVFITIDASGLYRVKILP